MSNTVATAAVDQAYLDTDVNALEDADVETKGTDDVDYDLARDEIYETDLLDEDSDLDMDRADSVDDGAGMDAAASSDDTPVRGGGDGSG